jgi:hypothetical protein
MKIYVWTAKAEARARKKGLEERKEGNRAYYGDEQLTAGSVAQAWLEKGYVEEIEKDEEDL